MPLVGIYQCFSHRVRLRFLRLLLDGPLCVWHLQLILEASQVEVSKQLSYLKRKGFVESKKVQCWRVYQLPENLSFELKSHLACLQECARSQEVFCDDLKRLGEAKVTLPGRTRAETPTEPPRVQERLKMPAWDLEDHLL